MIFNKYLHAWKADADDEVCHPVDQYSDRHCARSWPLREQFSGDQPGNRSGTNSEEHHKAEYRNHRQVAHPVNHFLHIAEELLSGDRNEVLSRNRPGGNKSQT